MRHNLFPYLIWTPLALLAGIPGVCLAEDNDMAESQFIANYFHLFNNYELNQADATARTLNTQGLQQLSMSYEGSTGLLHFGSGYLYTGQDINQQMLHLFQEHGFREYTLNESFTDSFLGLSAGSSRSVTDDLVVGWGASLFYGSDSSDFTAHLSQQSDIKVLLLLDLPVNIGDKLTITPEFQWSQTGSKTGAPTPAMAPLTGDQNIYGGVSIHFAY